MSRVEQFLADLRHAEVQAIGAAISLRSWQSVERAYNDLRDRVDAEIVGQTRRKRAERERWERDAEGSAFYD